MRIGFDTSPLHSPHAPGIVRVVRESLAALDARARHEIVRLAPPPDAKPARWRQRELPLEVARLGLAGIHSFVSAFPWRGPGKRVHTVHELPWKHGVAENADWKHRFWAGPGARRADATVTASPLVAHELGRPLASEGGRLHVVPWGVGPPFEDEPPPGTVDETVLSHYRLGEGHLALCPGAVRPKKNLAAVLSGLARLRERGGPELHLVVSGPHTQQLRRDLGLVARLGLSRWISTPGELEEEHLPALLRLASCVPVLSRSEGFGLPVLEALACGTPVVVPAGSVQAEVAGELAILVDPDDPDSVADGLARAIETREALRYELPVHARAFPWARTAEGIERVWEGLA